MIYAPSNILPTPLQEPLDLFPPALDYDAKEDAREGEHDDLNLDGVSAFETSLPKAGKVSTLSDEALLQLFGADIAYTPPNVPAQGSQPSNGSALFPPEPFNALQRSVRPGMNELSRFGYDASFKDPYGADMRNELRTLVRNAPIQGL